jgi:hypothetical protein
MPNILNTAFFVLTFSALCQTAAADEIYNVILDTAPLIGHPAGPFYVEFAFTDGSGYGDGNNTATASAFNFSGGSALGDPAVFGDATGSLETGVTITDTSFLSLFYEQFAPGLQLSFTLNLTSNDDSDGIPDGFTYYILDNSGVPVPTLAPTGDYFLTAALGSSGAAFNAYGSDPSRAPSAGGDPLSIAAPTVSSESAVPEPSSIYLRGGALLLIVVLKRRSLVLLV